MGRGKREECKGWQAARGKAAGGTGTAVGGKGNATLDSPGTSSSAAACPTVAVRGCI